MRWRWQGVSRRGLRSLGQFSIRDLDVPIEYTIDHDQRLVVARGRGIFTAADMFGYQREVWSRPDVTGYDELVDMTDVERIAARVPAGPRILELAREAAAQDDPASPT